MQFLPFVVISPTDAALNGALCDSTNITFSASGTLGLGSAKNITANVVIDGTGQNVVVDCSGTVDNYSIGTFVVNSGASLTLINLTLINAYRSGYQQQWGHPEFGELYLSRNNAGNAQR